MDTALRPEDPAVLIIPGSKGQARDPVVGLRASSVPPHFVQPWATVEVVRHGGGGGEVGDGGTGGRRGGKNEPQGGEERK